MAKDLNVFDKEYGLLSTANGQKVAKANFYPLTTLPMAMNWPSSQTQPTPMSMLPWLLPKKRSKHGAKPLLPNARPF